MDIYIDFEMNGTTDNRGNIISIGAIKTDKWEIVDTFYQLVALPPNINEIEPYITIMTGIKYQDLLNQPYFFDAFAKFMKWASDCDYIYCWDNADINSVYYTGKQMHRFFKNVEIEREIYQFTNQKFVDLRPYICSIDTFANRMSLQNIYQGVCQKQVDIKRIHNPVYDSEILKEVHKKYMQKAKEIGFDFKRKVKSSFEIMNFC